MTTTPSHKSTRRLSATFVAFALAALILATAAWAAPRSRRISAGSIAKPSYSR